MSALEEKTEKVAAEQRFLALAKAWRSETELVSKVTKRILHPAYQKIIGMGEPAIPLILKDLTEHGADDWFWALTAITDENPISKEIAGNMAAMTEAWLQWGRKAGYLNDCPSLPSAFPNLIDYDVTSPKDASYNCVAFAAGDSTRKWDPGGLPEPGYYWPVDPRQDDDSDSIDALKRAFSQVGYEDCTTGDLEVGYQKVALYAITRDDWLHAAVQEQNGQWSSKLGAGYDIRHKSPQCIEGPIYGKVVCFMKRRLG